MKVSGITITGRDATARLIFATELSKLPEWIHYLPAPGSYRHPAYGELLITPDSNSRIVNNFAARVYGQDLPIDAEHQTKMSGALGYIREMRLTAGGVEARIEWTERGRGLLRTGQFKYFSPEYYEWWQDPVDSRVYQNVAIGGAVTTRPFFKERVLKPLFTFHEGVFMSSTSETEDLTLTERIRSLETQLAERDATVASMSARLAMMEAAEQDRRFNELSQTWAGNGHVAILRALGEGSDAYKLYLEQQNAIAAQVANSALFTEMGSSQQQKNGAESKIDQLARKRMAEQGLTYHRAYTAILEENPNLYTRYLAEEN